jgi:hypothetical protein
MYKLFLDRKKSNNEMKIHVYILLKTITSAKPFFPFPFSQLLSNSFDSLRAHLSLRSLKCGYMKSKI